MGPEEKKKSNPTISPTQKMIYIVGPIRCNNSLLGSFLEPEIGAKCQILESLGKIPKRCPEETGQMNLVLWDCFGKAWKPVIWIIKQMRTE